MKSRKNSYAENNDHKEPRSKKSGSKSKRLGIEADSEYGWNSPKVPKGRRASKSKRLGIEESNEYDWNSFDDWENDFPKYKHLF